MLNTIQCIFHSQRTLASTRCAHGEMVTGDLACANMLPRQRLLVVSVSSLACAYGKTLALWRCVRAIYAVYTL